MKKLERDRLPLTAVKKHTLALELGDVLYYLTAAAAACGYPLSEIMEMNSNKLKERRKKGKPRG